MSEIAELLKEGESEKVEFKPSLSQIDKIIESVSAFSNTNGGTVVIGVRDKGEVLGVDIGERTVENLANRIKQNTDPKVYPSIQEDGVECESRERGGGCRRDKKGKFCRQKCPYFISRLTIG